MYNSLQCSCFIVSKKLTKNKKYLESVQCNNGQSTMHVTETFIEWYSEECSAFGAMIKFLFSHDCKCKTAFSVLTELQKAQLNCKITAPTVFKGF